MPTRLLARCALLALALLAACRSQEHTTMDKPIPTGLLFRETAINGAPTKYTIFIPRGYTPAHAWPCIVFLNGHGECGKDGSKQAAVGLGPALLADPDRWPCIVVFPQKPEFEVQWSNFDALVMGELERTRGEFNIDPDRIALTGLSQGGAGTWSLGARHPDLWSCLAPVCGYGEPATVAPRIAALPIWAFHGLKDDVVDPAQTKRMIEAVEAARAALGPNVSGPSPQITLFPEANHNAWDPAYRSPDLPKWILAQKRSAPTAR